MRKWQRDRMRRRKKPPESSAAATPQPEPLQPMYPELQEDRTAEAPEPQAAEPVESAAPEPPEATPETAEAQAGQAERAKRRRRRGGRGRAKPQPKPEPQAEPQEPEIAFAPPPVAAPEFAQSGELAGEPEPTPAPVPSTSALSEVAPELTAAGTQPMTQAPRRPARAPKGVVVLAIGLPGSGKTSWFKRRGVTPLSSDLLRTILFDNITEQRYQGLVFGTLRSLLRARLIARMPWNYVDATNLSPKERAGWIKMAREFGFEVHAVFFDVPVEVCMERNRRRDRMVPEDVMQRMAQKLRPPSFDEGFTKIIVVRVKKREDETVGEAM
jgi:predicted kinase